MTAFGIPDAEAWAGTTRDELRDVLEALAKAQDPRARILRRAARAAAYLLTVTAQSRSGGTDFSKDMLEELRQPSRPCDQPFQQMGTAVPLRS